jgi:hypothetical protein
MKDFKFLNKTKPERTYLGHLAHLSPALDEDEYSFRTRMLRAPVDAEMTALLDRFLIDCIVRNNPNPPLELPWGTIAMQSAQTYPDGNHRTCARGVATVCVVGFPVYHRTIVLLPDMYQYLIELARNE